MTVSTDTDAFRRHMRVPTFIHCLLWLMSVLGLGQGISRLLNPAFSLDVAVLGVVIFCASAVVEAYFLMPPSVPVREPKTLTVASIVLVSLGLLGAAFAVFGAYESTVLAVIAIPAGLAMFGVGCYSVWWAYRLVVYNRTTYHPFAPGS